MIPLPLQAYVYGYLWWSACWACMNIETRR